MSQILPTQEDPKVKIAFFVARVWLFFRALRSLSLLVNLSGASRLHTPQRQRQASFFEEHAHDSTHVVASVLNDAIVGVLGEPPRPLQMAG